GTTGRPKGCMRTHRNRFASMCDILVSLFERPLGTDDVWLHAGPMTHASGLFVYPHLVAGATQVILARFDPDETLAAVARHRVTGTVWVPTMLERVLASHALGGTDLASLRRVTYAGAPMAPERIAAACEALGGRLAQFYGMVEAIPPLSVLTQDDHAAALGGRHPQRLASAGRAVLGCDLVAVDDDGVAVPPGEVGELVVSGDHAMAGYWGREDQTGKALRGGRLWTGDLARIDEAGYVSIVDRRSDMIISGGYNVYPREVEDVIAAHPAVAEVAVVGLPDVEWGQTVTAYVVPRAGNGLDSATVLAHCQPRLAGFKKPRRVEVVADLPRGSTGKVSRKLLRERAWRGGGPKA
ncbi:MAG: AMP-binding protein, partial [Euzebyales bacterium]|nr:AMP-binding protein [Euzebyales bacterium]